MMNKKLILFAICMFSFSSIMSQVETNYYAGITKMGTVAIDKFKYTNANSTIVQIPDNHVAEVQKICQAKDSVGTDRFGYPIDISYSLNDGCWNRTSGGRLWTMTLSSEGATSLSLVFKDLFLPEGGELYISNEDESVVYGPVTPEALNKDGFFMTDIIPGSLLKMYLYEPSGHEGQSVLSINRVIHGCNTFGKSYVAKNILKASEYTIDVACYSQWVDTSNGVAIIMASDGTYKGCGSLMLTTDYSYIPYILLSFMQIDENYDDVLSSSEINAAKNWTFKFCSRHEECGGSSLVTSYSYTGAQLCSYWYKSQFALMQINHNVKLQTNINWLGWDRSGDALSRGNNILERDGVLRFAATSSSIPSGTCAATKDQMWQVGLWDVGDAHYTTHGSPLFDGEQRVVGVNYHKEIRYITATPLELLCFGKLQSSWTGNGTHVTRLSNWLDPKNTGQTTIDSNHPISIEGPSRIISSSTYSIQNLPSDMSVTWVLSDYYYNQNCLQQNIPTNNQCTITRDMSQDMNNATLTATIRRNGVAIQYFTKKVSASNGFDGTYYNGQVTKQIDLPSPLYVLPGTLVTITSPNLIGATVSQSGGNVTPTSWSLNTTTGVLKVGMPNSSGVAVVVLVTCSNGDTYTLPITTTSNSTYLSVSYIDNSGIAVSIMNNPDLQAEETKSLARWMVEAINSQTGQKVYSMYMDNSSCIIDTTGWKKGIYVIRAVVGEEIMTEKIVVK